VSCGLLYILKYIPGMHLRVTDEVEMIGLDVDQFFDEQIGDWSMLDGAHRVIHGAPNTPPSEETVKAEAKV